jgi:hypothetical protein
MRSPSSYRNLVLQDFYQTNVSVLNLTVFFKRAEIELLFGGDEFSKYARGLSF